MATASVALPDGFISAFISHTRQNLESAPIYRQWTAISLVSAVLEQKVYLQTSSPLYPHIYISSSWAPAGNQGRQSPYSPGPPFSARFPNFTYLLLPCQRRPWLMHLWRQEAFHIIRLPSEPPRIQLP